MYSFPFSRNCTLNLHVWISRVISQLNNKRILFQKRNSAELLLDPVEYSDTAAVSLTINSSPPSTPCIIEQNVRKYRGNRHETRESLFQIVSSQRSKFAALNLRSFGRPKRPTRVDLTDFESLANYHQTIYLKRSIDSNCVARIEPRLLFSGERKAQIRSLQMHTYAIIS